MVYLKYLRDTLGDFVLTMVNTEDDCEVDPGKLTNPANIDNHQQLLDMYCNMVWTKIISSSCYFPRFASIIIFLNMEITEISLHAKMYIL